MNHQTRTLTSLVILAAVVMTLSAGNSQAACMNKFISQSQGNKRIVTLLTGAMTFTEASELAKGIADKRVTPVEWIDEKGKPIASSLEFSAIRPMPVACGDNGSGSVLSVSFISLATPAKSMTVKFSNGTTVTFEEQAR